MITVRSLSSPLSIGSLDVTHILGDGEVASSTAIEMSVEGENTARVDDLDVDLGLMILVRLPIVVASRAQHGELETFTDVVTSSKMTIHLKALTKGTC